ncbi:MAG TPA: GNAT family N-acetyltransferase [Gemmatimonadaceae bacterium]|nr:GNAT family N-acetyltransferase [Gemmatimonadaceae bacterium]
MPEKRPVVVRETRPEDFDGIVALSEDVYHSHPWTPAQLASHHAIFPEGQFVALDAESGQLLGMAASLIIAWSDYEPQGAWPGFTDNGMFTNHDPGGRTLYGAEVMARPAEQGRGIGTALYRARRELAVRLRMLRIRAGARLRGYGKFARELLPLEYVLRVVRGELFDPTLSFQLRRGFHVIDVVSGYLRHDEESLGFAATIQWLNPAEARPEDYGTANPAFAPYAPKPG